MPICEADPWRLQYFAHVDTSANIPTEDSDAWQWYPAYRFVYDKLALALSQNLAAAPHGVPPPHYPVFSKPIVNLKGMGVGSRVLGSDADYAEHYAPGHFWMTLLDGLHVSSDIADGRRRAALVAARHRQTRGRGHFRLLDRACRAVPGIEAHCGAWIERNLAGYTGMLNLETIGGTIIEAHLRFADQWPDLYGPGWVDALVGLYERHEWDFSDDDRSEGYSVVLFGPHGRRYRHPPRALVDEIKSMPGVTSVQITFHEDRAPETHAMPPGGFRLAIVNGFDLRAALAGRERLRQHFLP